MLFTVYSQKISFKQLSNNDGLLSNSVNAIEQDADGFMWFGTNEGLSRYDGYSFLNFFHTPTNNHSLSNDFVNCLMEDKNNHLWIGTMNGLNYLNRETYEINRLTIGLNDSVGEFPIQSLALDNDDNIWIGSEYSGLYKLNTITHQVTHFKNIPDNSTTINSNHVSCLLFDSNRGLMVGTDMGLDLFDLKTQTFKHVVKKAMMQELKFYNDSSVFIGIVSKEKYYYKWTLAELVEKKEFPANTALNNMKFLMDQKGNQWLSIRDRGLFFQDTLANESQHLQFNRFDPEGLSSNAISSIYQDSFGNIWIGTVDAGINLFTPAKKAFVHIKDNYLNTGLQNNKVRSLFQDSEGDIWMGTKLGGTLSKFDRESSTFQHYRSQASNPSTLSDDMIFCITEEKPGYLWVGTSNGLNLFEKKSGKVKRFFNEPGNLNSIASNTIYTLLKNEDLLFIGGNLGLDVFDTKKKIFSHFSKSAHSNSISNDKVRVIYKGTDDDIWIGTIHGLNLFNKDLGTFERFENQANDSTSISANIIQCIHEDKKQNLWIGTILGLNLMNPDRKTFKVFNTNDGLPGNSINGIQEDDNGFLWLSTNNGLSKFNPDTKEFKNYTKEDGLQSNEFSSYVSCRTTDGAMLFGGNNGLTIFHPKEIIDNDRLPNVVISDFKLFNKHVLINTENAPLEKHVSQCKEITLTHKQSVFSFEFVALSFISAEKNQYAYMLKGFDKEWNYVGRKRDATYTNLNPGTYLFMVKASNNDGLWNEQMTSVKINILPPPWRTWWAYVIYVVLVMSLLSVVWLYAIKRVKEEKENEKNQENLKFFINVSHEFRTPLTLILNPLKKILSSNHPENKEAAQSIQLSANKLLGLVNQLLDFRKTDLGRLPLKAVKTDIVKFTKGVLNLFADLGDYKNIELRFVCKEPGIDVWFDPDKYEKILNNLLSNAMKFTRSGGQVVISIELISDTTRGQLFNMFTRDAEPIKHVEIRVQDTGIGLTASQKKHVFERFYSIDESKTGTGIGLNYTKSLVELHGGSISVESIIELGSTFVVCLPMGNKHLKNEQLSENKFKLVNYQYELNQLESLRYDIETTDESPIASEDEEIGKKYNRKRPVVLIVEDNKQLRKQLKGELEGKYVVWDAENGKEGWKRVLKIIPDLIISDIRMPEMDGNELCRKIKNDQCTSHIPVILLTAQTTDDQTIIGMESGADQYVTKPFSFDVLESRIKSLLVQRNKLQQIFSKKLEINPSEITVTTIDEKLIKKALDIVEKNISNSAYSVDELSRELEISRGHLYRKIMSITGKSPSDFIRSIRLKRAAQLLKSSRLTISEIAYQVGFSNPKYFTKCFKAEFNTLPSLFVSECVDD